MQFANEPANSLGFHWIGRYDDSFDVTAFGAVERAKFVSSRPRRDARKHHARLAFRAAESLNCEQRDCGWVIGHCIPPSGQAGAQNSQSPVDAEEGGDEGILVQPRLTRVVNIAQSRKYHTRAERAVLLCACGARVGAF
jgi:hypothetical protein